MKLLSDFSEVSYNRFMARLLALLLCLPVAAWADTPSLAPTLTDLLKEIQVFKARIEQLEAQVKALQENNIDKDDYNRIKTKAEALEDQRDDAGLKGLKISGAIDPVYIYSKAKNSASFSFLNNFSDINGSREQASYDNSFFGLAYLDLQKELEGGGRWRLTLAPTKSAAAAFNFGNIVHEASASIPLSDAQTRLVVGQIPDVSGYETFLNTDASNHFITHSLPFDFAAASTYTGAGLNVRRGDWEATVMLANFNTARNDINNPGGGLKSPTLIYNLVYTPKRAEYWELQLTGYEGRIANPINGGYSRIDHIELDSSYGRGDTSTNLALFYGRQTRGAYNGGDARWYGFSAMHAQKITQRLEAAARLDYFNNRRNGGGTYNLGGELPFNLQNAQAPVSGLPYVGDFINGFGPGDPDAPDYNPNRGANRGSLSFSLSYQWFPTVLLRGEYRYDRASLPSFYNFKHNRFDNSNSVFALSTLIGF